jgi:hypothetical protein
METDLQATNSSSSETCTDNITILVSGQFKVKDYVEYYAENYQKLFPNIQIRVEKAPGGLWTFKVNSKQMPPDTEAAICHLGMVPFFQPE